VRTPLEKGDAIQQLLENIIDDLSFSKLKEIIKARIVELGESQLFNLISASLKSEAYALAIIIFMIYFVLHSIGKRYR